MDKEIIAIGLKCRHNQPVEDIRDIVADTSISKTRHHSAVELLVILVVTVAVVEVMSKCYNPYIAVEEQNEDHVLTFVVVKQMIHCMAPEVVLDKAVSDHL